jgi:hypothetical protein
VNGKQEDGFGVGAISLARELARQIVGVEDEEEYISFDMRRGIESEWIACEVYAERNLVTFEDPDFITHPDIPFFGGTPDRLVGVHGGMDVKCPNNKNHHENILFAAQLSGYKHQFQSYMAITGREWWDFVSYNSNFPVPIDLVSHRMERDEPYIKVIEDRVESFWPIVQREVQCLQEKIEEVTV